MPRPTWTTKEQSTLIDNHRQTFYRHQKEGTHHEFWNGFYKEWFEKFPLAEPCEEDLVLARKNLSIPEDVSAQQVEDAVKKAAVAHLDDAMRQKLYETLWNRYRTKSKVPKADQILLTAPKKKNDVSVHNAFAKKFPETVKIEVDCRLAAALQKLNHIVLPKERKSIRLKIHNAVKKELFDESTEEVKQEVKQFQETLNKTIAEDFKLAALPVDDEDFTELKLEEDESGKESGKPSREAVLQGRTRKIHALPDAIQTFMRSTQKETGFFGITAFCGPNPERGGELSSYIFTTGKEFDGGRKTFTEFFPQWDARTKEQLAHFGRRVFPAKVRATWALPGTLTGANLPPTGNIDSSLIDNDDNNSFARGGSVETLASQADDDVGTYTGATNFLKKPEPDPRPLALPSLDDPGYLIKANPRPRKAVIDGQSISQANPKAISEKPTPDPRLASSATPASSLPASSAVTKVGPPRGMPKPIGHAAKPKAPLPPIPLPKTASKKYSTDPKEPITMDEIMERAEVHPGQSPYERQRAINIARNKILLDRMDFASVKARLAKGLPAKDPEPPVRKRKGSPLPEEDYIYLSDSSNEGSGKTEKTAASDSLEPRTVRFLRKRACTDSAEAEEQQSPLHTGGADEDDEEDNEIDVDDEDIIEDDVEIESKEGAGVQTDVNSTGTDDENTEDADENSTDAADENTGDVADEDGGDASNEDDTGDVDEEGVTQPDEDKGDDTEGQEMDAPETSHDRSVEEMATAAKRRSGRHGVPTAKTLSKQADSNLDEPLMGDSSMPFWGVQPDPGFNSDVAPISDSESEGLLAAAEPLDARRLAPILRAPQASAFTAMELDEPTTQFNEAAIIEEQALLFGWQDEYPDWMGCVEEALRAALNDIDWLKLIVEWKRCERLLGFPEDDAHNLLSLVSAPPNIRSFAKTASFRKLPNVAKPGPYPQLWQKWWTALQPQWRSRRAGARSVKAVWPLRRHPIPNEPAWDEIKKGGPRGVVMVLYCLGGWGKAAKNNGRTQEWHDAVADVQWVLEQWK